MSKAEAYERSEDIPVNPSSSPTLGDVMNRRYGRRDVLKGALAVTALSAVQGPGALAEEKSTALAAARFQFEEIPQAAWQTVSGP